MRRILILMAGFPDEILRPLIVRLKNRYVNLEVLDTLPLAPDHYTAKYAESLYGMVGSGLRKLAEAGRGGWWNWNFVVLYLRKEDGSECHVEDRFGMEALLAPLEMETKRRRSPQRQIEQSIVNALESQADGILRNARMVLELLAEEVTHRDSRTCVLLPGANFGDEFEKIKDCVHHAVENSESAEAFVANLRRVASRLRRNPRGRFRNEKLVFVAPAKAGARHGFAPTWDTKEHNDRCVIRGRLRFGVPYNPNFHYDCALTKDSKRWFTSCHGEAEVKRGRSHVNIAPNDNIR